MAKSVKIKFHIFCIFSLFLMAVDTKVFNSSVLESRFIGGGPMLESIEYVAVMGAYEARENMYLYTHLCTGFLVSSMHIASSGYCKILLNQYGGPNYEFVRAFIGKHELISNTWATCNSLVPARQIVSVLDYPIFHPVNERDNIFYSVSIVHLQAQVEIYFSPAPIDFRLIEPGELLFAIGWGAVRGNAQMVSNIVTHELRSSILCIENQVTCSHAFLGVQYNYDFITCGVTTDLLGEITNGDYGGPLINMGGCVIGIAVSSSMVRGSGFSYFLRFSEIGEQIWDWAPEP